jgi:hypothetical protein
VTDSAGAGIPGATVSLLNNNTYYTTTAGANGNFVLKTAAGQPLTPGASTLMCGGVTRSVTINSSGTNPTFQPLSGVDRTLALNGSLDYTPVEN